MSAAYGSAKEHGPRLGRVALSVAVVLSAGAVVAGALRFQAFSGAAYAMFAVFAFPAPVAIGLVAGLLSPRRRPASPLAWACIAGTVSAVVLSGAVEDASAMRSPVRVAGIAAAGVIAVLSGLAARQAVVRGAGGKLCSAVLLGAIAVAFAGCGTAVSNVRAFRTQVAPQVLFEFDSSHMDLPNWLDWSTRPLWGSGCYEMRTTVYKRPLVILFGPDVPTAPRVLYDLPGSGIDLRDDRAARVYLAGLGFRTGLLDSLVREGGRVPRWSAGFGNTRLTLTRDGAVSLRPFSKQGLRTGSEGRTPSHHGR